ncbi:type I CRISPR-associated protein Cas7 [uncultured Paracoccus sp.]|uniref:type I CRISPR-associated protein Cas7 n=1 Tax=uncultured Paracoccus sp. TaxID=189685 RepID=UPI0025DC3FC1|nr:type I CRISPR-associated protein Cas7 [uncultured Paracoccus sp.]
MTAAFNRGTGVLIINVVNSNPNGDPDGESEPRTFEADGRGLISPVSFKRKLRDLMEREESEVRKAALVAVGPCENRSFGVLESRGRDRKAISAMALDDFRAAFWDGRVFGNTFVEKADQGKFITTGVVQFGPGVSIAPVDILRLTLTNKAGVEGDKDRGMAPLAFRVVRHGLYVMPFFVNPSAAHKSGCDLRDIDVLKFLVPHAYAHTASGIRPEVHIVHAWYAEHANPLGSCPDPLILAALKPKRKPEFGPAQPSLGIEEYDLPSGLPDDLRARLASFEDLCAKHWPIPAMG